MKNTMSASSNRIILFLLSGILILCTCGRSSGNKESTDGNITEKSEDVYRDIVLFRSKIIAVGTFGRMDLLDGSGNKTPINTSYKDDLNCAESFDDMLIVAGNNGTILYAGDDLNFTILQSVTADNIYSLAVKDNLIVAGAASGTILVSGNGISWSEVRTQAKGNIISLSANESFFVGVSDMGETLKSLDGINWQVTDYNKAYEGYNRYCYFREIIACGNSIVIIGVHDDGTPSVLYSALGNVWAERMLVYDDEDNNIRYLESKPNDIAYDPDRDQFIIACDNGELFILPTCTKCNVISKVASYNLTAILYTGKQVATGGEDYNVTLINL